MRLVVSLPRDQNKGVAMDVGNAIGFVDSVAAIEFREQTL